MAEWEDGGGRGGDKAGKVTWGRKSLDSTLVAAGSCDSHELSSLLVAYLRDSQSFESKTFEGLGKRAWARGDAGHLCRPVWESSVVGLQGGRKKAELWTKELSLTRTLNRGG